MNSKYVHFGLKFVTKVLKTHCASTPEALLADRDSDHYADFVCT